MLKHLDFGKRWAAEGKRVWVCVSEHYWVLAFDT